MHLRHSTGLRFDRGPCLQCVTLELMQGVSFLYPFKFKSCPMCVACVHHTISVHYIALSCATHLHCYARVTCVATRTPLHCRAHFSCIIAFPFHALSCIPEYVRCCAFKPIYTPCGVRVTLIVALFCAFQTIALFCAFQTVALFCAFQTVALFCAFQTIALFCAFQNCSRCSAHRTVLCISNRRTVL